MTRSLCLLSVATLLAAGAQAQCLAPASGASVLPGFVKWTSGSGYTSTLALDDEGITNPPIAFTAFANFPMAGAIGNLDRMWVNSNGEIYLTDSTLALTQPVGGATYGVDSLAEMRGNVAAGSARVVPFGDDSAKSAVAGAVWDIAVDQSVPGEVRVTWTDMSRYANTTDRFSFDCTLFASGAVRYSYSSTIVPDLRYVGISIGNMVGTAASPSRDLTNFADSGTEGMLYESFTAAGFDLAGKQIMLIPNGLGGYFSTITCSPAFHQSYGTGCYDGLSDSVHQFFALPSAASPALQGNAMMLIPTPNGYAVNWVPGGSALYIAPTGGAANVFATASDDGSIVVTPSAALTIPGGSTPSINVNSNGVISLSATAANTTDYSPTSAEFASTTVSAVYTWHDWNESETGSGRIKSEEVGGILYVTWDNVESYADPDTTLNPGTIQFQLDLASGVITVVWPTISADSTESTWVTGAPYLVGLGGPGAAARGPVNLATALPIVTSPNTSLQPLALSASPAPVYTIGGPSVPITYTASNMVDLAPPLGIGIGILMFSVAPFPGGLDMGFLDMPGCNLNILSLDVTVPLPGTAPTAAITLSIPQPLAPGLSFYSQVLCLFAPNSLPNGQNAFGGILSNGLQSSFNTF
ncbi:MAG: hypothetical protein JNK78_17340 [Planctomycetes bacterium]|nr:hypothetical protein [Planctomycetota bacterium]